MSRSTLIKLTFMAFVALLAAAKASDDMEMVKVEDSTVSPIADMAILDAEMKTSTERPPVMEPAKQDEKTPSQRHTVADFIIHPLIAFKPRNPEDDGIAAAGKQANNGATSTTTPSPWQLFGFNAGQGLGSQVTNLAGQVSGWLNDRIQFPGLVETPVRESSTTSTSTTTTPRPDVVVRVQHKASTRRPLIAINNRNRPNRPQFESDESEDDDENEEDNDDENNSDEETDNNDSSNEAQEGNNSEEDDDDQNKDEENSSDEEEENHSQRPNNRRRPLRNQNNNNNKNRNGQRRRVRPQQQQQQQNNRRRVPNRRQQQAEPQRRRPAAANAVSDEDVQDDDEYVDNDDFYYGARPSTKRSQSNQNFIQRGQQQLINQIRQLTRGQTPAEVGTAIRKAQRGNGANNRRRQQATLFVNRNGQTIYVAPELAPMAAPQYQQIYAQPIMQKPMMANAYPQPPLTVPLKRKGQPTQYITIPWAQLGISPPNNIVSITEGIQAQPLILNIPQSAINTMQTQAAGGRPKKKRPQLITAEAVPLLAEASLMDIFKPPQIPPSRTSGSNKPMTMANATPVIVAAKPSSTKTSSALFQQRIRPGTIVEKAPEMEIVKKPDESETKTEEGSKIDMLRATGEKEYILVGEDNEPGLTRQVEPVFGDARYVRLTGNSQYYDVLPRRRFTVRRGGRELASPEESPEIAGGDKTEKQIPVHIVNEPEVPSTISESAKIASGESVTAEQPAADVMLSDPKPALVPESEQQSTDADTKMTT